MYGKQLIDCYIKLSCTLSTLIVRIYVQFGGLHRKMSQLEYKLD